MSLKRLLENINNKKYNNYINAIIDNIDYFNDIVEKNITYNIKFDKYETSFISEAFYIYYSIEDEEVQEDANEYAFFKIRIADHDPKRGDGTYIISNIDIKDILQWEYIRDPDETLTFKDVMMEDDIIFEFSPNDRQIEIEIQRGCNKLQEKIQKELHA